MLQRGRKGYKSFSLLSRAGSNIFLPGTTATTTENNNSACLKLDSFREDNGSDNSFLKGKNLSDLEYYKSGYTWEREEESEKIAACLSWTWILSSVIQKECSAQEDGCRGFWGHLNNSTTTALAWTWNGPVTPSSEKSHTERLIFRLLVGLEIEVTVNNS